MSAQTADQRRADKEFNHFLKGLTALPLDHSDDGTVPLETIGRQVHAFSAVGSRLHLTRDPGLWLSLLDVLSKYTRNSRASAQSKGSAHAALKELPVTKSAQQRMTDYISRAEVDSKLEAINANIRASQADIRAAFAQSQQSNAEAISGIHRAVSDLAGEVRGLHGEITGVKSALTTTQWAVGLVVALSALMVAGVQLFVAYKAPSVGAQTPVVYIQPSPPHRIETPLGTTDTPPQAVAPPAESDEGAPAQ